MMVKLTILWSARSFMSMDRWEENRTLEAGFQVLGFGDLVLDASLLELGGGKAGRE
jgi:hypothetical protein